MKILLYTHAFAPMVGGVETSVALLAEGLAGFQGVTARENFSVTVATTSAAEGFVDSGRRVKVVRGPSIRTLIRLIKEADVVHIAGPCLLPLAISWLACKPVIIVHHGYQSICPNGLLFKQPSHTICPGHFMLRQYGQCVRCCTQSVGIRASVRLLLLTFPRRWLCNRAVANISVTDHVKRRVQLPRTQTIYHGIDQVSPPCAQPIVYSPTVLEFAYIGRFVAEKGLPILLQAAKYLLDQKKTFRLTFIGDGPERSALERTAKDLALSEIVQFKGTLRGTDLVRAVSSVSVVVMPSVWEETAGLAAIEQMMRGRLVIASDIGGLREIVNDAGLRFAPGDWHGLASCMRRAIEDPTLVFRLGHVARDRAIRLFHQKRMIECQIAVCLDAVRF